MKAVRTVQIERNKLSNQVLAALREMIENHRFEPGARVNVEELTRALGVSRTPVWEAIHRLEQEGLLVRVPHRGVFMAELSLQQAQDLYEVRQPLEAMAGRLAATRVGPATLRRMQELLEEQRAIVTSGDLIAYSRSDFAFHAAVYDAAGNRFLEEVLQRLKSQMRPLALRVEPYLEMLYEDHVRLLAALARRDPDGAEAVFREHNEHLIEAIHDALAADAKPGTGRRAPGARSTAAPTHRRAEP